MMHMALSVDADRFDDRYLKKNVLPLLKRKMTPAEFRTVCAEHRAAGFTVFPPCDNTKPDGTCAGHAEDAKAAT